ncbi:MAG TPA: transcriptional regulator [Ruminococcaceae bacterium]|nr:transcriptional regulator [Oscillospiraceae bacterium]
MNQTLGSRIAELRRKKNMTQEELAAELGVTAQAVSKWENDLSCPDITLLPQLARLFGVTIDELLGNQNQPETTLLPEEQRKPLKDMIFRIYVNTKEGDKVRVNLPMALVQVALQMGMQMPQVSGSAAGEALKNIDIAQLVALVEQGVIGKLVEVETADGDTVEIYVE